MAFVYLGGDDSTRPTFFEAIAADKLLPSLKTALVYALSVFSQRHPWVHRLLDYEDEVLALALLAADWHSLYSTDATLAESLYGLRRRTLPHASQQPQQKSSQQQQIPGANAVNRDQAADAISARQKHASLILEALIPYLRTKSERWYRQHTQHTATLGGGGGVVGIALQRGVAALAATPLSAMQASPWQVRARHLLIKCYVAAYPYLHAACELTSLGYHVAYLLGASPCHRPVLHALNMQLARVSAQDLGRLQQQKAAARKAALAAALRPGRPRVLGLAHKGLLQASYLLSDNARHGLILIVFGFKALEWWFTSAEARLAEGKTLKPPPPPPPPPPAYHGVGLPEDPMCCPVCKQELVNPAQVASSGYVGCYKCLFEYITQQGCCPVTQVPSTIEHIRKLYDAL